MASEAFQLALLLTLKDAASGGLDRFEARLRSVGKAGEHELAKLDRLREDLNKNLAFGGIGLAGLKIVRDGVQAAGDYQAVMTDLRSSLAQVGEDGRINLGQLAQTMAGAEEVAVRLGNKLPGTTADFAQMMQVLKQNGLDAQTIINGAADAVANLAVASNAVPREIAADFAQFGNLFKLRAVDFTPAADVFARIYSSTGQTSAELVEAAKYFEGRTGQSLGIKGLKDAEQFTRMFGFLGKQGIRGTMAGTGLSQFFDQYQQHKDKLDDLQKATGIKLKFFDDKGTFVGLENVIAQMSQFSKLSDEARANWMSTIFGELGKGVGNVLVDGKAWKEFNQEQNKTISLAEKTAMKAKDYNMQMEALEGTLTNLKVSVFETMLPSATALVGTLNDLAGAAQGFAKAHPDVMKYAVGFLALNSAALVAYSGLKTAKSGMDLYRMASKFSKGEGFVSQLADVAAATEKATKTQAGFVRHGEEVSAGLVRAGDSAKTAKKGIDGLSTSVVTAEGKMGRLRSTLSDLAGSRLAKIAVGVGSVVVAEAAITYLVDHVQDELNRKAKSAELKIELTGWVDEILINKDPSQIAGLKGDLGKTFFNSIDESGLLQRYMHPERSSWAQWAWDKSTTGLLMDAFPYGAQSKGDPARGHPLKPDKLFDPETAAKRWARLGLGQATRDPMNAAALLRQLPTWAGQQNLTDADLKDLAAAIRDLTKMGAGDDKGKQDAKWEAVIAALKAQPGGENTLSLLFDKPQTAASAQRPRDLNLFPSVYDLRNPLNVQPFSPMRPIGTMPFAPPSRSEVGPAKQPKSELYDLRPQSSKDLFGKPTEVKPQPIDLSKLLDLSKPAEALNQLTNPVSTNVTHFQNLAPQAATNVTNFQNLAGPAADSATGLGSVVDPANRLPGSFARINTSVGNVAGSLDTLSTSIASWRPPAVSGLAIVGGGGSPGGSSDPVVHNLGAGKAVGAVLTRSGLEYVHAKEEIVPARSVAFRDTLGSKLVASLEAVRSLPAGNSFVNNFPSPLVGARNTPNLSVESGRRGLLNLSMTAMPPISDSATTSFSKGVPGNPDHVGIARLGRRDGNTPLTDEPPSLVSRREETDSSTVERFAHAFRSSTTERRERYEIDPELIRDADRRTANAGGNAASNDGSGEPAVVLQMGAFNFSPQIVGKTIDEAERDLDRNYKSAKERYLRQLRKDFDNRRQRS